MPGLHEGSPRSLSTGQPLKCLFTGTCPPFPIYSEVGLLSSRRASTHYREGLLLPDRQASTLSATSFPPCPVCGSSVALLPPSEHPLGPLPLNQLMSHIYTMNGSTYLYDVLWPKSCIFSFSSDRVRTSAGAVETRRIYIVVSHASATPTRWSVVSWHASFPMLPE